jgi:hypothetical protein
LVLVVSDSVFTGLATEVLLRFLKSQELPIAKNVMRLSELALALAFPSSKHTL